MALRTKPVGAGVALAFIVICAAGHAPVSAGDQGPGGQGVEAAVERCLEALRSDDFEKREAAQADLVALGAEALPLLKSKAESAEDPELRIRLSTAVQKIEFRLAFKGPLEPHLTNMFSEDPVIAQKAAQALAGLKSFGVPWLRQALESGADQNARPRLLKLIEQLDSDPETDEAERFYRKNVGLRGSQEAPPGDHGAQEMFFKGLGKKAVRFLRIRYPDSLAAARTYLNAKDFSRALDILLHIAQRRPDRLLLVLSMAAHKAFHDHREYSQRIARIEEIALKRQQNATMDEAADLGRALASWHREYRKERIEAFQKEFPDAAKNAATERDGLLESAFNLSSINKLRTYPDPLDRLQRLTTVTRRLEGGDYDLMPSHRAAILLRLQEFWLTPEDLAKHPHAAEEMLPAYRVFFRNHFLAEDGDMVYYFESKMRTLHRALGAAPDQAEKALDAELEAIGKHPAMTDAVRFLRACRFLKAGDASAAAVILESLGAGALKSLYGRKALAVLANAAYASGRHEEAQAMYGEYARRFPFSDWAWVAALRAANCELGRERWKEAIEVFRAARSAFPEHPLLVPAAHARIGWLLEELEDGDGALREYETALSRWDDDFGDMVHTPLDGAKTASGALLDPDGAISKEWVKDRIEKLSRAGADRSSVVKFEKALRRRLAGRAEEALGIWKALTGAQEAGAFAIEARGQISRTLVERAATLADRTGGAPDEGKAAEAIAEAAQWGDDFGRFCAEAASAFLMLRKQGSDAKASGIVGAALEALMKARPAEEPRTALEKDVAAARDAAFRPYDLAFFARPWEPQEQYLFHVADPGMRVIFNDGSQTRVSLRQKFSGAESVVFLSEEERDFLKRLINAFGACEKSRSVDRGKRERIPGDADDIVKLLNRFFPVFPGHWGGWHLETFPILQEMRFKDDKRESAVMKGRVGYRGVEALIEKTDGAWSLEDVQFTWKE